MKNTGHSLWTLGNTYYLWSNQELACVTQSGGEVSTPGTNRKASVYGPVYVAVGGSPWAGNGQYDLQEVSANLNCPVIIWDISC